jgi:hypothetical protein
MTAVREGKRGTAPAANADGLVAWAEESGRQRPEGPARGGLRFAFYGRVSTEDWQDPVTSRARQREQAEALVRGHGVIVAEFFDADPETAHIVRWIFARRLAGHSVARIARALNDAGVPCPSAADPGRNPHRTGAGWTLGTLTTILSNPRVYGPSGVEPAADRPRPGRRWRYCPGT